MMSALSISLVMIFGYLIGSIPFGLIITKICSDTDIRHIGSGNIGATNVLRTGKKTLALATLILDALKGAGVVLCVQIMLDSEHAMLAGMMAVTGHAFPLWLKFNGGKGVATGMAVFTAMDIIVGGAMALCWLVVARLSRISSLAALTAFGGAGLYMLWLLIWSNETHVIQQLAGATITLLVWGRHYENIRRLRKGEESSIKF